MSPLPTYFIIQTIDASDSVCVSSADYYPTAVHPKPIYRCRSVSFAKRSDSAPLAFQSEVEASSILFAIHAMLPTLRMKVVAVAADPTKFHVTDIP